MNRENKTAIFVDGSNFSAALKAAGGWKVDWDRVLEHYGNEGRVVDASYFTALPPKTEYSSLRSLTDRLSYHGWTIVTKETKSVITHDGFLRKKGNMDIEIAVKAMKLSERITNLVLFSGDGDFRCLVDALQERTVHVSIVSYYSDKDDCVVADELRRQANSFTDIRELRSKFEQVRREL